MAKTELLFYKKIEVRIPKDLVNINPGLDKGTLN